MSSAILSNSSFSGLSAGLLGIFQTRGGEQSVPYYACQQSSENAETGQRRRRIQRSVAAGDLARADDVEAAVPQSGATRRALTAASTHHVSFRRVGDACDTQHLAVDLSRFPRLSEGGDTAFALAGPKLTRSRLSEGRAFAFQRVVSYRKALPGVY
jgi:hypothetical protein